MINPEYGITRNKADDAWYVVPVRSGALLKPFFDEIYGDCHSSYAAAKEYNDQLRPYKTGIRNHQKAPRGKTRPDLPIGITLATRVQINKGGKGTQLIYNLKVNRLADKQATVYVGTEITWQNNFDAALEKAIAIREKSKQAVMKQANSKGNP